MRMTDGNGESPILSLSSNGRRPLNKSGDWLTRADAEQMVTAALASEIPKIHDFYLNQIPSFVARMVQDGLLAHGLIRPIEPEPVGDAPSSENVPTESEGGE